MTIRTGRRTPNTLYLQAGDEPSDQDWFLGSAVTAHAAALLAEAATVGLAHHGEIYREFLEAERNTLLARSALGRLGPDGLPPVRLPLSGQTPGGTP